MPVSFVCVLSEVAGRMHVAIVTSSVDNSERLPRHDMNLAWLCIDVAPVKYKMWPGRSELGRADLGRGDGRFILLHLLLRHVLRHSCRIRSGLVQSPGLVLARELDLLIG